MTGRDIDATTLAHALSLGDFPRREYRRLCSALRVLLACGIRVFDGDAARAAFASLPPRVTIYRGTCVAEVTSGEHGLCWSLDCAVAGGFALRHEIARFAVRGRPDVAAQLIADGFDSPSVVLIAAVRRDDIAGVLLERGEREVIALPEHLSDVRPARPDPISIPLEDDPWL